MERREKRKIIGVSVICVALAIAVFLWEQASEDKEIQIFRNTYGEGSKTEEYTLTIPGEIEEAKIEIQVGEREYTPREAREMLTEAMKALDTVVLGENKSFDRVEKNLQLPTSLPDYPVEIQWELDAYDLMNIQGEIQEKNLSKEGRALGIRGVITYQEEEAIYLRTAMVYPLTRTGTDKLLYEVEKAVEKVEEASRQEATLTLPSKLGDRRLEWSQKKTGRWIYILLLGGVYIFYELYRSRERKKQVQKNRRQSLLSQYPNMISKFAMLLGTGTTVKQVWEKIVQDYEKQRENGREQLAYEEMGVALREMNSGVSETEAYERFGRRCEVVEYIKFGALLSQNLRKGSKGLSDVLRMEVVRSFEERKATAKRMGEEAGTKLLLPMLGMLGVVMIMVMVPAFLTMG